MTDDNTTTHSCSSTSVNTNPTLPAQQCDRQPEKPVDEMLKCPVCCSQFTNPHVLSCHHTFCLRCLKGRIKKSTGSSSDFIKCPVCRKKTTLGPLGLKSVPKNIAIFGMLKLIKKANVGTSVINDPANISNDSGVNISDTTTSDSSLIQQSSLNKSSRTRKKRQSIQPSGGEDKDQSSGSLDVNRNRATKKRFTLGGESEQNFMDLIRDGNFCWSDFDGYPSSDDEGSSSGWKDYKTPDESCHCESCGNDNACGCSCPPTPELKSYRGIKLHMPVYVFGQSGRYHRGVVHVLEKVEIESIKCARVYAGVALERENGSLVTKDLKEIKHSYLYS